ncbi:hypothetical protein MOE67_01995 [Bacillus inaquosorum]|uniref:hypothetical protein n=1 Tax=Bacillus inaquosorum TaxID=483913 RepID=UPI0022815FCB|nr:hypothetical protein [Bacillus inaquosorum]MCY9061010.1 hypothetical protein [Bacillus inaquosorum]
MSKDFAWSCVGLTCIAKGIGREEAMKYIEKAGKQMGRIDAATSLRALLHRPYFEDCRSIEDFISKVKRDTNSLERESCFRFLSENVGSLAIRFVWLLVNNEKAPHAKSPDA